MNKEEIKENIISLLEDTERPGIESLINWMDEYGFFTAPCSGQFHLCKDGGLAEHSLNVYKTMQSMSHSVGSHFELAKTGLSFNKSYVNIESLIIVSLLHDLGKTGQFGKPNYVPNMISDRKGGYVQSDKKPYETNKDLLAVPHEIRSIQIASQFIELTEEESFAILMHNGMYSDLKYAYNGKETPLSMLVHFADLWCSMVVEA